MWRGASLRPARACRNPPKAQGLRFRVDRPRSRTRRRLAPVARARRDQLPAKRSAPPADPLVPTSFEDPNMFGSNRRLRALVYLVLLFPLWWLQRTHADSLSGHSSGGHGHHPAKSGQSGGDGGQHSNEEDGDDGDDGGGDGDDGGGDGDDDDGHDGDDDDG